MRNESNQSPTSDLCYFCEQGPGSRSLWSKSLIYEKYFETFNFYFAKPVNELLTGSRTSHVILFKDYIYYDNTQEIMRRYYKTDESGVRQYNYTEFYSELEDVYQPNQCIIDQRKVLNKRISRFHKLKKRIYEDYKHQEELGKSDYSPASKLHYKTKNLLKNINHESKYLEELNINETYKEQTKKDCSETDYCRQDKFINEINGVSFQTKMHDIFYPEHSSFHKTKLDLLLEKDDLKDIEKSIKRRTCKIRNNKNNTKFRNLCIKTEQDSESTYKTFKVTNSSLGKIEGDITQSDISEIKRLNKTLGLNMEQYSMRCRKQQSRIQLEKDYNLLTSCIDNKGAPFDFGTNFYKNKYQNKDESELKLSSSSSVLFKKPMKKLHNDMSRDYNDLFNLQDNLYESKMIYNKKFMGENKLAIENEEEFNIETEKSKANFVYKSNEFIGSFGEKMVCIYNRYGNKVNSSSEKVSSEQKSSEVKKDSCIDSPKLDNSHKKVNNESDNYDPEKYSNLAYFINNDYTIKKPSNGHIKKLFTDNNDTNNQSDLNSQAKVDGINKSDKKLILDFKKKVSGKTETNQIKNQIVTHKVEQNDLGISDPSKTNLYSICMRKNSQEIKSIAYPRTTQKSQASTTKRFEVDSNTSNQQKKENHYLLKDFRTNTQENTFTTCSPTIEFAKSRQQKKTNSGDKGNIYHEDQNSLKMNSSQGKKPANNYIESTFIKKKSVTGDKSKEFSLKDLQKNLGRDLCLRQKEKMMENNLKRTIERSKVKNKQVQDKLTQQRDLLMVKADKSGSRDKNNSLERKIQKSKSKSKKLERNDISNHSKKIKEITDNSSPRTDGISIKKKILQYFDKKNSIIVNASNSIDDVASDSRKSIRNTNTQHFNTFTHGKIDEYNNFHIQASVLTTNNFDNLNYTNEIKKNNIENNELEPNNAQGYSTERTFKDDNNKSSRKFNKMYKSCKEQTQSLSNRENAFNKKSNNDKILYISRNSNKFYGSLDGNTMDIKNQSINIGDLLNNNNQCQNRSPTDSILNKKVIPKLDFDKILIKPNKNDNFVNSSNKKSHVSNPKSSRNLLSNRKENPFYNERDRCKTERSNDLKNKSLKNMGSNVNSQYFTKSKEYLCSSNNFGKKSLGPSPNSKKSNINNYIKNVLTKGNATGTASNTMSQISKLKMIKSTNEGYKSNKLQQYQTSIMDNHKERKSSTNQQKLLNCAKIIENDHKSKDKFKKKSNAPSVSSVNQKDRRKSSKTPKNILASNIINMSNSNLHHYHTCQSSRKPSIVQKMMKNNTNLNQYGYECDDPYGSNNKLASKIGIKFEKIFGHKLSCKGINERTPSRNKFTSARKKKDQDNLTINRSSNNFYRTCSSPYNIDKIKANLLMNTYNPQNTSRTITSAKNDNSDFAKNQHYSSNKKKTIKDNKNCIQGRQLTERSDVNDEYNINFTNYNSQFYNDQQCQTARHYINRKNEQLSQNYNNSLSNTKLNHNTDHDQDKNHSEKKQKPIKNSLALKKQFMAYNTIQNSNTQQSQEGYVFDTALQDSNCEDLKMRLTHNSNQGSNSKDISKKIKRLSKNFKASTLGSHLNLNEKKGSMIKSNKKEGYTKNDAILTSLQSFKGEEGKNDLNSANHIIKQENFKTSTADNPTTNKLFKHIMKKKK